MSSKRLLTTLLIICLLVAFFYLASGYFKQGRLQSALTSQINDANRTLSLIPKSETDLEKGLAEVKQANTAVKQSMASGKVNVTQIVDSIYTIADQYQLQLTPLSTQAWTPKKVADNTFNVLTMELRVEGGFSDLLAFTGKLENKNTFPYMGLDKMTVNGTEETIENSQGVTDKSISADITITLFTLAEESNSGASE